MLGLIPAVAIVAKLPNVLPPIATADETDGTLQESVVFTPRQHFLMHF